MNAWKLLRWIDRGWWAYLFGDMRDIPGSSVEVEVGRLYVYRQFPWPKLFGEEGAWERIVCRAKGHPKGEVFYNPGGYEPDHHCQTCGEDLG